MSGGLTVTPGVPPHRHPAGSVTGLAAIATSGSASDLSAGSVPAARMPAHTGDVTSSAGSVALTVADGAVSLAKMANLAANSIIGNNTGSSATPIALTAAQVRALLALATVATSGSAADLTGTLADARLSGNVALLNAGAAFTSAQTIDRGTGSLPSSVNASAQMLRFAQADGTNAAGLEANTWSGAVAGGGIGLYGVASAGTRAVPAATIDGTTFFAMGGFGHNGSAYTGQSVLVRLMADGTWSAGNAGTKFVVSITDNGSTSRYDLAAFARGALSIGSTTPIGSERLRITGGTVAASGSTDVNIGGGSIDMGTALRYRGTQVVGARRTGWTAPTGTATRTGFATSTATLTQVAETLKALIDDLHNTAGHGIIGT